MPGDNDTHWYYTEELNGCYLGMRTAMDGFVKNELVVRCCDVCDMEVPMHVQISQKYNECLHCNSHRCMNVVKQKAFLDPARFNQLLESQRRAVHLTRDLSKRRIEKEQLIIAQEARENECLRRQALESAPNLSEKTLAVVSIPTGPMGTSTVSYERITNYKRNLREAIAVAKDQSATKVSETPATASNKQKLSLESIDAAGKLCEMCKGGCCTYGGDKAYITASTIAQRMQEHPTLSVDDILDVYLSYLPIKSISNSCINHSETGCALPRQWRSDVCNEFFCPEIKRFGASLEKSGIPTRVLVVKRNYTHWNRYELERDVHVTEIKSCTGDLREVKSIPLGLLKRL